MQWTVRPYTPADEAEWDRFVMHESGNGTFVAKDYLVWLITLPGVDFSIGPNGHLHINI